jgi:phage minor structural protein
MVQVYADGALIYDSRIQELALLGLSVELGLEKAGAATITLPPDHPAYGVFVSYRTEVTIYRDSLLLFRGRALYPSDDFLRRRTITCEGERCFLRDGVMRPYMYQDGPAAVFTSVIELYNAQVEAFKQFKVGTVTVTDPNDYIRIESESAEAFSDTVDKLVERCGGYIVFTTDAEGQRCINWLADVGYTNNQVVEFGENLLDFSRTGENTDLATVIVPYGAKDETSGTRITIESVNDGLDFIQDYDAVALRGVVAKAVYWDDITEPANLLTKARQYLNESKQAITSLELTAVDLSIIDKNIDSFRVGDIIRVRSRPHGVDDDYRLTERKMDLLNPAADRITLGKSLASLTGADAAGDRRSAYDLQKVERSVVSGYTLDVAAQIEAAKVEMTSLIQQTGDAIQLEVSEQYATNDEVTSAISTSMTQLADQFEFLFTELQTTVDANDAEARAQFVEIEKYIRFIDGNIILGEEGNEITLRIENDRISFLDAGAEVAYFSNQHLTVVDGSFLNSLQVGKFAFIPRENGNLSLVKVGD